ncbi:substance-P receptor-like [Uranotaenia lowii]|uniref:substance-P receptor-like n=1 Tax=Uranotaenia lowii TaxID=190385 RepID=UPI0024784644|nr:substance-P receptor-like [Uranotaenia lowii]XP_055596965.1 substance-P receptor-like [Uranotaenia lowii]XP_055596966.1 substance-P receptor-like [Uranotaenia lowii]
MGISDAVSMHYANNYTLNTTDVEIIQNHEALYDVPVGLVVLLSVFYGTISVLAVIGNSLVIWIVLTTKQMQTITNMFIANLALADVIIAMFAIPFQFQAAVLQRWNLPDFMCPFCPFVQLLSVNVSVFTLTAIAVDRHRAIINPLRARASKNISKFIISAIWMLSFGLSAPTLFALRVIPVSTVNIGDSNETYINITKPFCQVVNFEQSEMLLYRYILTLVQYFIPLCVISFVYIQMALRLWGSKTPGNAQDSRDMTMLKNKKKVIKMLIIVVALFAICWFPLQLYNVLHVTWPEVNEYRYINIIWFMADWLAMSNSCYNPFIYGIYNEKFKREFRKRYPFRGCCCFGASGSGRGGSNYHHHDHSTDKTLSMFTRVSSVRSNYATSSIRNKLHHNINNTGSCGGGAGIGGIGGGLGRPLSGAGGLFGNGSSGYQYHQNHNPVSTQQQQQFKTTNLINSYASETGCSGPGDGKKLSNLRWEPKMCPCRQTEATVGCTSSSSPRAKLLDDSCGPQPDDLLPYSRDRNRDCRYQSTPSCGERRLNNAGSNDLLILDTEDDCVRDGDRLEPISLEHPHPDSVDDNEDDDDEVMPPSCNQRQLDCDLNDTRQEFTQRTSSRPPGKGAGSNSDRFHIYCNDLQNFKTAYN